MAHPQQYLLALLLAPLALALRQPYESESLQAIASPKHKAEVVAGDEHLRCTRACGCGDHRGFFARTAAARGLYLGCNSSKPAEQPDLLLVGVTKGGTTSFLSATRPFFCGPWQEVHYFDNLQQRPTPEALRRDYLSHWGGGCQGALTFEKTPAYFFRGSAALRICEALPGQKLAVLLREPLARSYSHYWESESNKGKGSPEDFHARVVTEMEVVRRCGGMALGRPEDDLLAGPGFKECCEGVAGQGWLGCSCLGKGGACNAPYGMRQFSLVRFSIYVRYLRIWFRYHRPERLLILFSEDFFADMPGGMCEAHCHADALRAQQRCSGQPARDFRARHRNSETRGPMLPATRALLRAFFAPYNEELFALLGRRAPWG